MNILSAARPRGRRFFFMAHRRDPAVNNILADRILTDLIQQLDAVRDLLEQADTADALQRVLILVDDALRQATNFLFELRRQRLGI
jgi:hypothetical protein